MTGTFQIIEVVAGVQGDVEEDVEWVNIGRRRMIPGLSRNKLRIPLEGT